MKKLFTASEYARFERMTALALSADGLAAYAATAAQDGADVSHVTITRAQAGAEALCTLPGRSPAWSPDGRTLAWLCAKDGPEQVWLCDADGGNRRQLTTLRHGATRIAWAPDGSAIAFEAAIWPGEEPFAAMTAGEYAAWQAAQRLAPKTTESMICKYDDTHGMLPPSMQQVGIVDAATGAQRMISDPAVPAIRPAWTPDGSGIVWYGYPRRGTEALRASLYLYDLNAGGIRCLLDGKPLCTSCSPCFTEAGDEVVYSAYDMTGGMAELLYSLPLAGGEPVCLFEGDGGLCDGINCMPIGSTLAAVENGYFQSADGWVYFLCGWHGHTGLYRISEHGGVPEVVYTDDKGSLISFCAPVGGRIACVYGTFTEPGDVYMLDGSALTRVTRVNGWLDEYELADCEEYWIPSRDGKAQLQTWLMRPVGWQEGKLCPTVLYIHGGPQCTWVTAFWHELQALASAGLAAVYCNPRGSTGYGRSFLQPGVAWGDEAQHDLMDALQSAIDRKVADPDRLGLTGGSYGGYMTNKLAGEYDCFKAAVSQRALVNTATSYGTGDMGFASAGKNAEEIAAITMKEYIGDRVRGGLMGYVEKMTAPMLFLHAFNDYRCSFEQSEQMFMALRERKPNLPLRIVMLPGDNHGVARDGMPRNLIRHVDEMVRWFRKHLGGEDVAFAGDEYGIVAVDSASERRTVREFMWPVREAAACEWPADVRTLELPAMDGAATLTVHWLPGEGQRIVLCPCESEAAWIPEFNHLRAQGADVVSLEVRADMHCACADALTALDAVTARMGSVPAGLVGFGRGGTAALWLSEYTQRFVACAVYGAEPNRLISYASSSTPGGSGDYETFRDYMWSVMNESPVFYAEKADMPILLLHGEQDLIAPVEGAHQLYIALKDTHPGRQNRLVLFPEAGHEPPMQRDALDAELADWINAHLR